MIKTHHHREPPTCREIGRSTIARYPGDPLPAWLGGDTRVPIRFIRSAQHVPVHVFGETPTLPDYEERT
ncbi:hypothetical protein RM190_04790 [Paracoccus sp. CPCC 101403]|uniref:Uncharacterized protein n=1 Tax=Paracoccus broussonetiae TaxID=3075834 RepID=A0ABU3EAK5_9RHOB|nr:hypothetical protein [Paracoccus sp. CPCC 101403]MDT1061165.1 hypothetical protein [Paracoccus sp. CPCC 101403]